MILALCSFAIVIATAGFIIVALMMRNANQRGEAAHAVALRWIAVGFAISAVAYLGRVAVPSLVAIGYVAFILCVAGMAAIYKGWIDYWKARRADIIARLKLGEQDVRISSGHFERVQ